jgi:hypothetical protein
MIASVVPHHVVPSVESEPHNTHAERWVVGGIIQAPDQLEEVRRVLRPDCFFHYELRLIYRAVCDTADAGEPIDLGTIETALERSGHLDEVGGFAFLGGLAHEVFTAVSAVAYAKQVLENAHRRTLIRSLEGILADLAVGHGDLSKIVGTLSAELESTAKEITRRCQGEQSGSPEVVDLADFLARELPPRELLLAPWLPRQGLAMIHAYRGIGKTHVALGVGYAVASGGAYLCWQAPRPPGVLLLDGEMPAPALQERLAAIVRDSEREAVAPFHILTPDLQPKDRPPFNLANVEDQEMLEPWLNAIELVIVDNIATLARTSKTNDAESWLPIQEWALRQRASGRSVMFIHHSGKSGTQRGTSAKEDVLDTVIGLRRPSDYDASQGARFEIHFEKARGFTGKDAEPLEAAMVVAPAGRVEWRLKPLEDSLYERVIELRLGGLSQTDIADDVGRHKSSVCRMLRRAREEGRIRD